MRACACIGSDGTSPPYITPPSDAPPAGCKWKPDGNLSAYTTIQQESSFPQSSITEVKSDKVTLQMQSTWPHKLEKHQAGNEQICPVTKGINAKQKKRRHKTLAVLLFKTLNILSA